jgi:TonB family protein
MIRNPQVLLATAVMAWSVMSPAAAACSKPAYPRHALQLREDGISVIGFLVREDGTVAKSVVLNSSGSRELDEKTADAMSLCPFKPVLLDGKPVEAWQSIAYTWVIDDDPEFAHAIHTTAVAASKGDLAARYQLSMLLRTTAKTDADRDRADTVLRSAADRGLAHAQFEIGRQLEQGHRSAPKDVDAAMPWYQKAAEQGDVFAIQRLEKGILP